MFLHKNKLTSVTDLSREFVFRNDSKLIYPLLSEIIAFVKIHLPSHVFEENISNCKQALIELLTNAVKHSKAEESLISVCIEDNHVQITKTDKGKRFYLDHYTGWPPLEFPFFKSYIGEKIKVYEDDICSLQAIIQNENRIAFELLEFPIGHVSSSSNLIEHYGLLILTKVSDEFYYVFDSSTSTNHFTVVINLS